MKVKEILVATLFVELVIVCIACAFRFVNPESAITLIIFNFLFISIIFQLNGSLTKKFFILTAGNLLGLLWNYLFFQFSGAGVQFFGNVFKAFYALIFPFVNITWIVPFWSFSLSLLTSNNPDLEVNL